jgi:hypothetical protein
LAAVPHVHDPVLGKLMGAPVRPPLLALHLVPFEFALGLAQSAVLVAEDWDLTVEYTYQRSNRSLEEAGQSHPRSGEDRPVLSLHVYHGAVVVGRILNTHTQLKNQRQGRAPQYSNVSADVEESVSSVKMKGRERTVVVVGFLYAEGGDGVVGFALAATGDLPLRLHEPEPELGLEWQQPAVRALESFQET